MLYIDVAKIDRDVTHVVMVIHVCFKCFQIFHLFQTNVASVLSGCYIYIYIASICFKCFRVFHTYVCECFIYMLYMFAMVFKCF
jgi:K+ transporter